LLAYAHVLSAVGWLGAGIFIGSVLGPNLQRLSPPARLEFMAKVNTKITSFFSGAVLSTLIFGWLLLYFIVDGDFSRLSPSTTFGATISTGTVLALAAAILAFSTTFPAFKKVGAIAEETLKGGQQPPPELAKYSKRARTGSVAGAILLLIVLALMVAAGFY